MALDRPAIAQRLFEVIDPELGLDIVSLGLIYDLTVTSESLTVVMTLTFPGCPLAGYFQERVRDALKDLALNEPVKVDIVFEPAWTAEMIDPDARLGLGFPAERPALTARSTKS